VFAGFESGVLAVWLLRVSAPGVMRQVGTRAIAAITAQLSDATHTHPPLCGASAVTCAQQEACSVHLRHAMSIHIRASVLACSLAPNPAATATVALASGSLFCTVGSDNSVGVFSLKAATPTAACVLLYGASAQMQPWPHSVLTTMHVRVTVC